METKRRIPEKTVPKSEIRKKKLAERRLLKEEQCRLWSHAISERLLQEGWYGKTEHILLYSAVNQEVDLADFVEQAWKDRKRLYFPRVNGSEMEFYRVDAKEKLTPGFFHISEPDESCPVYTPVTGTVMIVPGVAFSDTGDRIGYGKGYYDRYLNCCKKPVYLVGAAYEMQLCRPWETEEFDRKMDVIITEQRKVVCDDESGTNV